MQLSLPSNKSYIESPFFTSKNPNFVRPNKLIFPGLKKQTPLNVKSSIKTSAVLTYHHHMIPLVFNSVAWVYRSLSCKPKASWLSMGFFEEGDLIQLHHDGNYIFGVVQHTGFTETTLMGPVGLIILQNLKMERYSIKIFSQTVGNEKLFGFYTFFHRKTDQPHKFVKKIESLLEKNEIVKDNAMYNMAHEWPNDKFSVSCYVNCSKLQSPIFKSYLEVSGQVLADVYMNAFRNKAIGEYLKFW